VCILSFYEDEKNMQKKSLVHCGCKQKEGKKERVRKERKKGRKK